MEDEDDDDDGEQNYRVKQVICTSDQNFTLANHRQMFMSHGHISS